ncbi:hypothetical protein O2K51_01385 [Apibacter raozihei]|uniref:hypothetical protein n=1 Tax=Apibacter raozihei TaxID=2500547 RepID=UPI000FE36562|nr:hypothetical protein [Apibacter raozihei]
MKKTLFVSTFLVFTTILYCQVGINTDSITPGVMLDINGRIRIRDYSSPTSENSRFKSSEPTYTKIMVMGENGLVSAQYSYKVLRQSDSTIINIVKKSVDITNHINNLIDAKINSEKGLSYVRGRGNTKTAILSGSLNLFPNWKKIAFDFVDLDNNNDYNSTNSPDSESYCFTAPMDGIYDIYVQYELNTLLSAQSIGVGIFKIDKNNVLTLLAENTYQSINISLLTLNVDVSPPTRQTKTLVRLEQGDKIFFALQSTVTINLLKNSSTSTFFTISQVR